MDEDDTDDDVSQKQKAEQADVARSREDIENAWNYENEKISQNK